MTLNPDKQDRQAPIILQKQDSFFTEVTSKPGAKQATEDQFESRPSTRTTDVPMLPLTSSSTNTPTPHAPSKESRFLAFVKGQVLPCAAHPNTVINNRLSLDIPSTRAKVGILLNCFAGFLSCMHLLFGTVVFASLNFIDVVDAVQQVSLRFLASSIVPKTHPAPLSAPSQDPLYHRRRPHPFSAAPSLPASPPHPAAADAPP